MNPLPSLVNTIILGLLLILTISTSLSGQSKAIKEKFDNYQETYHLEKVYVSHDKPYYTPGDTVWCKVYFVDGRTHQFFDASPTVHADWVSPDDSLMNSWMMKIHEGVATFEIPIPFGSPAGDYTVRAHTQYQRNFDQSYLFQKNIKVISEKETLEPNANEKNDLVFDVQFMPEGGDLITGLNNKVAFKAIDVSGAPIDITGTILSNSGEEVQSFKTYHEGIGFFDIKPDSEQKYKASTRYNGTEKTFDLPKIEDNGYVLNVNARGKEFITVNVSSNTKSQLDGASLFIHTRGVYFSSQDLDATGAQKLKIPRSELPSGVVHFTLFDHKNRPVCERIAFNKNQSEKVEVALSASKERYNPREQVEIDVSTLMDASIVPSSLSLSVYNRDLLPVGRQNLNIVNYLLLQSDLKGRIDNINQYFNDGDSKTNFFLDLLMMTHGWRRFTWKDVMASEYQEQEFGTEENISIIGQIKKRNKDEAVKADVFLNILSKSDFTSVNMTTEDDGIFFFKGFEFKDTTDVMIQANIHDPKKKKKLKEGEEKRVGNNNVDIEILELDKLIFDSNISIPSNKAGEKVLDDLVSNYEEVKHIESIYNPDWSLDLSEFTVRAVRKSERQKKEKELEVSMKERGMFYFPSSQKIFMDDLPGGGLQYLDVFQAVRGRAPGVEVRTLTINDVPTKSFVIRNATNIQGVIPALITVDGSEINPQSAETINPQTIKVVDIIKGLSATSVFGERGAGGVVSIILKDGSELVDGKKKKYKGTLNIDHPGFYTGRQYYSPNYGVKSIDHQKPDYRTSLFWEPNIRIKDKAQSYSFYAGDKGGNYLIKVEGISTEGYPFVGEKEIFVEYKR